MIEVNATLFALLLEACALLAIALLGIGFVGWRRRARTRSVLRALVAEINSEADHRLQTARERVDAAGEGDNAQRLNHGERSVCQAMVRALSRRSPELLAQAYAELKALVDAHQALLVARAAEPSAAQEQALAAKDAALRTLKSDYERSTHELAVTQRTMEKMLHEYSSMFAGGADELDQAAMLEQMKQAAAAEIDADAAAPEALDITGEEVAAVPAAGSVAGGPATYIDFDIAADDEGDDAPAAAQAAPAAAKTR